MINIYFRCDSSDEVGLGHVTRCIALAQMLCNNFRITFIYKTSILNIVQQIKNLNFLNFQISGENDIFNFLKNGDIVVIDSYDLDSDIQLAILKAGCKLVCIDDIHDKIYYADLIINHAPNVSPYKYKTQPYTQFALGLDYVLLRPEFIKKIRTSKKPFENGNLVICFGGGDFKNLTCLTVNIVLKVNWFNKVNIIVGAAYKHIEILKTIVNGKRNFEIHEAIDPNTMCKLLSVSEVAIVPASGILQEAISVGNTIISGFYMPNQKNIYKNFKSLNAFIDAKDFSENNILKALQKSVRKKIISTSELIDGKSDQRLLKIFNNLANENNIVLRKANLNDLSLTFNWATNNNIRKFSFNQTQISQAEHCIWFNDKISSKNCEYFLASENSIDFGSIRFDIINRSAKISYLIDPLFQNKGLGIILLKKGLKELIRNRPGLKEIIGEVIVENIASINTFRRLGFRESQQGEIIIFKKMVYENF